MPSPRSVLYVVWLHWVVQLAVGLVAALMLVAGLASLVQALRVGEAARAAPAAVGFGALLVLVAAVATAVTLGLSRVEGDLRGLVVRRFGGDVTVAWSDVVAVDRPWWAFNPSFPIVRVRTRGGPSLRFVAGPAERERLEALRRAAASGR